MGVRVEKSVSCQCVVQRCHDPSSSVLTLTDGEIIYGCHHNPGSNLLLIDGCQSGEVSQLPMPALYSVVMTRVWRGHDMTRVWRGHDMTRRQASWLWLTGRSFVAVIITWSPIRPHLLLHLMIDGCQSGEVSQLPMPALYSVVMTRVRLAGTIWLGRNFLCIFVVCLPTTAGGFTSM